MSKAIQFFYKILISFITCLMLVSCTSQIINDETSEVTLPSGVVHTPSTTFTVTIQPATSQPSLTPTQQATATKVLTPTKPYCPPGSVSTGDEIVEVPIAYIGRIYKDGPLGGTFTEGFYRITEDGGGDYRLTYNRSEDIGMMWLEKYICQDENGDRFYEVKDVIVFPEISEVKNFSINLCEIGNEYIPDLIVYGKVERGVPHFFEVLSAWKTNVKEERFEPVASPENANCVLNWDGIIYP